MDSYERLAYLILLEETQRLLRILAIYFSPKTKIVAVSKGTMSYRIRMRKEGQELYDYAGIRRDSPVLTNDYEVKLISFFGMHAGYCIEADTFVYWMD